MWFLKFTLKRQQQNIRQLRLLTYVGRPNKQNLIDELIFV